MNKYLFLMFLLIFLGCNQKKLNKNVPELEIWESYISKCSDFTSPNFLSTENFKNVNKSIIIARKLDNYYLAKSHSLRGHLHELLSDRYDLALNDYLAALRLSDGSQNEFYCNLGHIFTLLGDYKLAEILLNTALKNDNEKNGLNISQDKLNTLSLLGYLYYEAQDLKKSEEIYDSLKEFYINLHGNEHYFIKLYLLRKLSISNKSMDIKKSKQYIKEYEENKNVIPIELIPFEKINWLFELGNYYLLINDFESAEKYYIEGSSLIDSLKFQKELYRIDFYYNLGNLYNKKKDMIKSYEFFSKAESKLIYLFGINHPKVKIINDLRNKCRPQN